MPPLAVSQLWYPEILCLDSCWLWLELGHIPDCVILGRLHTFLSLNLFTYKSRGQDASPQGSMRNCKWGRYLLQEGTDSINVFYHYDHSTFHTQYRQGQGKETSRGMASFIQGGDRSSPVWGPGPQSRLCRDIVSLFSCISSVLEEGMVSTLMQWLMKRFLALNDSVKPHWGGDFPPVSFYRAGNRGTARLSHTPRGTQVGCR